MRNFITFLALGVVGVPTGVFAQTVTPATEISPEAIEAARRIFREGVEAAQAGRWEQARELFARTLQIRPAAIVKFNLAVACQNVNRFVEATDLFRQFVREMPESSDPERVRAAREQIADLERRVASLRIDVNGDQASEFLLDGRSQNLSLLGVVIPVDSGPHRVEVRGTAGDHQVREGAVFEGESMRVEIELAHTPPVQNAEATPWSTRTQSFGHWVARPGPGGRWIDWATRASNAPISPWKRHPFSISAHAGFGALAGSLALSGRYFPQPWFGIEALAGTLGAYGPSGGLMAHGRFTTGNLAVGAVVGLAVGYTTLSLSCNDPNQCNGVASVRGNTFALNLAIGASLEYRFSEHFSFRTIAGARLLTNPDDLRAVGNRQPGMACTSGSSGADGAACNVFETVSSTSNPFLSVDLSYSPLVYERL
jgi:hypothetical protein